MTAKPDDVIVEYRNREDASGFWLDVFCNREPYSEVGPFGSAEERKRALEDMLEWMRSVGAQDMPVLPQ